MSNLSSDITGRQRDNINAIFHAGAGGQRQKPGVSSNKWAGQKRREGDIAKAQYILWVLIKCLCIFKDFG